MRDNAVGLSDRMQAGADIGGKKGGEQQVLQGGKAGADLDQRPAQVVGRQMGEHCESNGMGDGVGHAGEVEIGVLDQMAGVQAGFVRDFRLIAAFQQRAG